MGPYDKGFTNTFWTETLAMGPHDNGFTNTLWTQTIVMGPYDKEFTNTFPEIVCKPLVIRSHDNGLYLESVCKPLVIRSHDNDLCPQSICKTLVIRYCHGTVWQGVYKHFLDRDSCHGPYGKGLQTLCERMTPSLWMCMTMEPRTLWRDIWCVKGPLLKVLISLAWLYFC
jgi:hypothetical protein